MEALVLLALVGAVALAVCSRRPALAEPLGPLSDDFAGPMVVKAPRAGRVADTDVAA